MLLLDYWYAILSKLRLGRGRIMYVELSKLSIEYVLRAKQVLVWLTMRDQSIKGNNHEAFAKYYQTHHFTGIGEINRDILSISLVLR